MKDEIVCTGTEHCTALDESKVELASAFDLISQLEEQLTKISHIKPPESFRYNFSGWATSCLDVIQRWKSERT